MAEPSDRDPGEMITEQVRLRVFKIEGLFGVTNTELRFPERPASPTEPSIVILSGPNGCGKTTVLRMIRGMLALDFDEFRRAPFQSASLTLSTGDVVRATKTRDKEFPLRVHFNEMSATLALNKHDTQYSQAQRSDIDAFRKAGLRVLSGVDYELLETSRAFHASGYVDDIQRTAAQRSETNGKQEYRSQLIRELDQGRTTLSERIRDFMRDAQVNYRKFFAADDSELLPKILGRMQVAGTSGDATSLLHRVQNMMARTDVMKRFGLQTDEADLLSIASVLSGTGPRSPQELAVIETYVETRETGHRTRELIVHRLLEFESIMDDFLVGKTTRIDLNSGLRIRSEATGQVLSERHLSSGEYNFLYMMVAALLVQREGSIIAIDEPELSLHVAWQRRLISALSRGASGASPVFLFATHSPAIAAEHRDSETRIDAVE